MKPMILCIDMESVLTPEIWEEIAKKTGINELLLTTRDIGDYDQLMKHRLACLKKNGITFSSIKKIVSAIDTLPGSIEFLEWIKERMQVVVLSDSFIEISKPIVKKLGNPTIFSHNILVENDNIIDYKLRINNQKAKTVQKFKELNFTTIAIGDSFNDTGMLKIADYGYFYRPSEKVKNDFPNIKVTNNFEELKELINKII